jgi:glycerophosphoryl diester phosphodiesterase
MLSAIALAIAGGGFGVADDEQRTGEDAWVFAHRGVAAYGAENSSEAFELAIKLGFEAIETDVRATKDGKLIIFHDQSGDRLLQIDKDIHHLHWREIKDLPLYHNGKKSTNTILSLANFLEKTEDSIILYLDIKDFTKAIADSLLLITEHYTGRKRIIIASSKLPYLAYMKYKKPEVQTALEGFNKGKEWIYYIIPKKFKPDYYASFIDKIDISHMQFIMKNNLLKKRIAYGVNSKNIVTAYELGLRHIILDYDSTSMHIQTIKDSLSLNTSIDNEEY